MPENPQPPCYLVAVSQDQVAVRIQGKATYMNCAPMSRFFEQMLRKGKRCFVIEFDACQGMDSTFLGIMASVALEVRKLEPKGCLTLRGLGERNLQLVRNLGLHRVLEIDERPRPPAPDMKPLEPGSPASRETMLAAHQSLVQADQANLEKFQDVIAFLKKPD